MPHTVAGGAPTVMVAGTAAAAPTETPKKHNTLKVQTALGLAPKQVDNIMNWAVPQCYPYSSTRGPLEALAIAAVLEF